MRNYSSLYFVPYVTWYSFLSMRFFIKKKIIQINAFNTQEALWLAKRKIKNNSRYKRLEFLQPINDIEFIAIVSKTIKRRNTLCH